MADRFIAKRLAGPVKARLVLGGLLYEYELEPDEF
jgi:hypothetical protein